MDEEANSWLRRTKFSHTVYHRVDSARLASIPLTIHPGQHSGLKSRPNSASFNQKSGSASSNFPNQPNPINSRQRSLSPLPETVLPDAFKEAKSDRRRFSTPGPRRRETEKGIMRKLFNKDSQYSKASNSSNTSPLRHLESMKVHDKSKGKKESAWTKYFDHGGGRVNAVEAADELTVDLSKLFLGLKFAHGAHSKLYHGLYNDEPVAVKIINVPDDDENGSMASRLEKQYNREVTLLSRLHHQNVIKFVAACRIPPVYRVITKYFSKFVAACREQLVYCVITEYLSEFVAACREQLVYCTITEYLSEFVAACRKPPVYCVITEYLSEGSLRAYLHKLERRSLSLEKLIPIALDIARGMEYIHSQGVIHRDLKPENILIDQDFQMKIADFGIACEEVYCDSLVDDPGTYRWMAPEMIKKKSYGRKVDVYSFGLILWEMVTGTIPYEDMAPIQAAFAVVDKNLRPVIPADCPPAMRALIEQCWSLQPEKRPEFWQVVKVLEQFESSLARDGTLTLVQNPSFSDHKKGLPHWIQKLGPMQHPNSSPVPKPKFM